MGKGKGVSLKRKMDPILTSFVSLESGSLYPTSIELQYFSLLALRSNGSTRCDLRASSHPSYSMRKFLVSSFEFILFFP